MDEKYASDRNNGINLIEVESKFITGILWYDCL